MPILHCVTNEEGNESDEGASRSWWFETKAQALEQARLHSLDDWRGAVRVWRVNLPNTRRGTFLGIFFNDHINALREHIGHPNCAVVAGAVGGKVHLWGQRSKITKLTDKYWETLADKKRIERDPVGVELELRKLEKEVHRLNEKRKKRLNEAREGGE